MTKVVRIPLICATEEIDYIQLNKYLWKIQRDIREIKNKTIQFYWEWQGFASKYNVENGIYPKVSEVLPKKQLRQNIYYSLKRDYPELYSQVLDVTIKNACDSFKNAKREILKGEKSIISFKKNQPIDLHNQAIKLDYNPQNNKWMVSLKLFSSTYKSQIGLSTAAVTFNMQIHNKSQHATQTILERCYDGIYKIGESKLIYNEKKKQWFLNLVYNFNSSITKKLDPERIMGVDLGIAYAVYISFNCCLDRYKIEGGEITKFRHDVERRKRQMLYQGKYCGNGRIGHGTLTRIKPIERLNKTISNFRDTINHRYSKYIIDKAIHHECGTIQMENLKGIAKDNIFLKEWTYFDLRQKVEYKAKEKGIHVLFIDPQFTSKRCCKCGFIHDENRPKEKRGQAYFKCIQCGFEENADYNASQNIATKGIEQIIKNTEKHRCE